MRRRAAVLSSPGGRRGFAAAGLLVAAGCGVWAGCNEIAGIRPVQICETDGDCGIEPGCGTCNQGACVFAEEGAPAPDQTGGDCQVRLCDGRGGVREGVHDAQDAPEDTNPCTETKCEDGEPVITPLTGASLPCYDGPPAVAGIGACALGAQSCEDGALAEACEGTVLPAIEICGVDQGDLDCDGVSLEAAGGGDGCCGDGNVDPMEECDDANPEENDGCSSACKIQEVLAISAGGNHTCALLTGGVVKCWGANLNGQTGHDPAITNLGTSPADMGQALAPVDFGDGLSALAIAAGGAHACALLAGGVMCWGSNSEGQLGVGVGIANGHQPSALGFVSLGSGAKVTAIASGGSHACALLDNQTLKCWGDNSFGQLGIGSTKSRGASVGDLGDALPAVYLGADAKVLAVACGTFHTCALLADDTVKCWGQNLEGQLGVLLNDAANAQGDAPNEMTALPPVPLPAGLKPVAITAGRYHSCAAFEDGSALCWGRNVDGELGLGSTVGTATAMALEAPVAGGAAGEEVVGVEAGGKIVNNQQMVSYGHTCALLKNRTIKCWGDSSVGQLGRAGKADYGKTAGQTITALAPVAFSPDRKIKAVEAGGRHTCALFEGGAVRCWGDNSAGQLGQGKPSDEHYSDQAGEQVDGLPPVNLFGPAQ